MLRRFLLPLLLLFASPAWATVTIAPNDPGIYYSPGNWGGITSSAANTINAGAYFKTLLVNATTAVLNFDVSHMVTPQSEIYWRMDRYGPWTSVTLSSGTVTLSFPSDTSTYPQHFLEVYVKSTTETANRFQNVGQDPGTAVILTSMTLSTGASVSLPAVARRKILVFGDSITEGVRTINSTATNDTDRNDGLVVYSQQLGILMGAEVGVIGFGNQGWGQNGSGNVPSFQSAYQIIYFAPPTNVTVSRSFAGIDLVIINQGTNDHTNDTTTIITSVVNGMATAGYTGPIVLLEPFDATTGPIQKAFILAGIAAATKPGQSCEFDTTGFFNPSNSSDGLHPFGAEDIAHVAPAIASGIEPCIFRSGGGRIFR